ncbi:MAG: hypothetical protein HDQ97_00050 [Lachnospiraceae bacterium]|nr:hypothetical protein [Lachnospiraceae bacterium]
MGAEIDRLEVQVETQAKDANGQLDILASKLGKISKALSALSNTNGFKDVVSKSKQVSESMSKIDSQAKSASKAVSDSMQKASKPMQQLSKTASEIAEKYKDLGKDFQFFGNAENTQKQIEKYSNALETAKLKKSELEATGNTEGKMYEYAIRDIQKYSNMIASLEAKLHKLNEVKVEIGDSTSKMESTYDLIDRMKNHIQQMMDGVRIENPIDMTALTDEEFKMFQRLKEEASSATQGIKENVSEISQKVSEFKGEWDGVEFPDTLKISEPMEKVKEQVSEVAKAMKLSKVSTEEFESVLNSLSVPKIKETNLTKLQNKLKNTEENIAKLQYQLEKGLRFGTIAVDDDTFRNLTVKIKESELTADSLREKIQEIETDRIRRIGESAKISSKEIIALTNELQKLKDRQKELSQLGLSFGYEEFDQNTAKISEINQRLKEYQSSINGANQRTEEFARAASSVSDVGNKISSAFSKISTGINKLLTNMNKVVAFGIRKMIFHFGKLKNSILDVVSANKKSNLSFAGGLKTILKYSFGIRSLFVLLNKMRSAIKDGFGNLVQYSAETNHSISLVTSALGALKNALSVAFAPIVNVVAPYITKFINMMTDAFNAVGRFFAALTGKKIAVQATKYYKDYAAGLSGVADAAKKASKALHTLGIDELNIINESDSDSGASGGDVSIEDMFTDLPIEGAISDWAKKIRDAFLAQDWERLGKEIAELVNAGLRKIYDFITDITPKVEQALKNFAKVFNSFVEYLDWDLLGRTIGAGVNLITKSINALLGDEGIDFENLGRKLSVGFRGLVDEIDWRELGNAFGNAFMVAWRILDGFIEDMSRKSNAGLTGFAELGNALGTAVNGLFERISFEQIARVLVGGLQGAIESLAYFVGTIKWGDIADNLNRGIRTLYEGIKWDAMREKVTLFTDNFANAFNSLVHDVDWRGIGSTIGAGIDTIARTVNQLTDKMDFIGLGNRLAKGFMGLVDSIDWNQLGRALTSGIRIITDVLYGFVSDIDFGKIGVALGNALNGMVERIDLGKVGATLGKLITGIFQMAIDFSKTFDWKKLGDNIANGINELFKNMDAGTVVEGCISLIGGLIDALIETVEKTDWKEVVDFITDVMFDPRWWSLTGKLLELAWALVKGLANGIWQKIKEITWGDIWNWILECFKNLFGIHSPSTVMEEQGGFLMQGLLNGITAFIDSIIDVFRNIKDRIVEICSDIKKAIQDKWAEIKSATENIWSGITDFLANTWENIKNTASTVWETIKNTVINVWDGVCETISNIWNGIKNFLSEIWESIKSIAINIWESVKNFFENTWNSIRNTAEAIWNNISTFLQNVWQEIKNKAVNIWNSISEFLAGVWNGIKNLAENVWNSIYSFLQGIWESIKNTAEVVWNSIVTLLTNIWESIKNAAESIWSGIKNLLSSIWESIKSVASTVFNGIKTVISGVWETIKTISSNVWNVIKSTLTGIWEGLKTSASTIFEGIKTTITGILSGIIKFISGVFSGDWEQAWNGIVDIFRNIINVIPTVLEGVLNGIISGINGLINGINGIGGNIGISLPNIPEINLPRFATGGFPEDGLFLANHSELVGKFSNGKTAVANNEQIISGIEEAAYRGFARAYAENTRQEDLLEELIQAVREGRKISIDGRELVTAYDNRKTRNGYAF